MWRRRRKTGLGATMRMMVVMASGLVIIMQWLGKGKSDVRGAVGAEKRFARGWGKCQRSFQKPLALKSRCDHCRAGGGRGDMMDTAGRTACRARG